MKRESPFIETENQLGLRAVGKGVSLSQKGDEMANCGF